MEAFRLTAHDDPFRPVRSRVWGKRYQPVKALLRAIRADVVYPAEVTPATGGLASSDLAIAFAADPPGRVCVVVTRYLLLRGEVLVL
jgi:hypothetical protein